MVLDDNLLTHWGTTLDEMRDRMRRLETRMTKYLELQGFETQVRRPVWKEGTIDIPSMHASLRECIDAVPADWGARGYALSESKPIYVIHKDTVVAVIHLGPGASR